MPSSEPVKICFSYEFRSDGEARVHDEIVRHYTERAIPIKNLFDAQIHERHEAGFNLARWEALCRFIEAEGLHDTPIIMQDITDVYVADTNLDFDEHDVFVNRKKNCQYHALKTLFRDIRTTNVQRVNLSRRIDIDCTTLDSTRLKALFLDPRYRSIYRFSNDVLWGYGRNFLRLFETIGRHIDRVPDAIRYGNCDETLFTYFHLEMPDVPLNLRFGERACQNYNYIGQEIFRGASAPHFVRSKPIFTYQHSDRVPALIDAMSQDTPASSWKGIRASLAYAIDQVVSGLLSFASVVLQALKRWLVAGIFLGRRALSY